jgi:hypothetical protein
MATWEEVLDTLAHRVDEHRSVLSGGAEPAPYTLPSDLGPLPRHLAARAKNIVAAQHDVENELRSRMGTLNELLHRTRDEYVPTVFLDARG